MIQGNQIHALLQSSGTHGVNEGTRTSTWSGDAPVSGFQAFLAAHADHLATETPVEPGKGMVAFTPQQVLLHEGTVARYTRDANPETQPVIDPTQPNAHPLPVVAMNPLNVSNEPRAEFNGESGMRAGAAEEDTLALAATLERIAMAQALAQQNQATPQQQTTNVSIDVSSANLFSAGTVESQISGAVSRALTQGQPQTHQMTDAMLVQPDSNARLSTEAARQLAHMPQVVGQNAAGQQPLPAMKDIASSLPTGQANALGFTVAAPNDAQVQATLHGGPQAQPSVPEQINLQGMSTAQGQPVAASSATLSAPLASAGWQQQLGQQVLNMHMTQDHMVRLRLHPAELGPLMISMKVDEQAASMQFSSQNPNVRAAVEQALPQLRELLAEQGITLGDTDVRDQNSQENTREFTEFSDQVADNPSQENMREPESVEIPLRNGQIDLYA
ncbi:flagellar hook-length control protein FliK [Aliidiomarina sanyensis]|uniref:Flagellar hook-length control protein-like C-terminal domain-containing protein n=1 Tax=Aliidiomarina sanyensis TaxID=1249555 RepID=A0A432WPV5_9GAMM|nr:flagellar hook-length control protein FliK [Aliidiomarina sanyensis]RUO35822.1 hypothetical protein CWE11_03455 [Aliidiomarina sanyensis]